MEEIIVKEEDFAPLKGSSIVMTGGSSGIGLAFVQFALEKGAFVVSGDINPPPAEGQITSNDFTFVTTDVTDWESLKKLFRTVAEKYGRIDHVFSNAGIAANTNILTDDVDENGELKRPDRKTFEVNLLAFVDVVKLGVHYIRRNSNGGSIVMTASSSAYQRFPSIDYATTKHGVLGLMRSLHGHLPPNIRINTIAPSWTLTGLLPIDVAQKLKVRSQPAVDAARSAALLMADKSRSFQMLYSLQGKFCEIEEGKGGLLEASDRILAGAPCEDERERSENEEGWALIREVVPSYIEKFD